MFAEKTGWLGELRFRVALLCPPLGLGSQRWSASRFGLWAVWDLPGCTCCCSVHVVLCTWLSVSRYLKMTRVFFFCFLTENRETRSLCDTQTWSENGSSLKSSYRLFCVWKKRGTGLVCVVECSQRVTDLVARVCLCEILCSVFFGGGEVVPSEWHPTCLL